MILTFSNTISHLFQKNVIRNQSLLMALGFMQKKKKSIQRAPVVVTAPADPPAPAVGLTNPSASAATIDLTHPSASGSSTAGSMTSPCRSLCCTGVLPLNVTRLKTNFDSLYKYGCRNNPATLHDLRIVHNSLKANIFSNT